jgi:hypothetical protein
MKLIQKTILSTTPNLSKKKGCYNPVPSRSSQLPGRSPHRSVREEFHSYGSSVLINQKPNRHDPVWRITTLPKVLLKLSVYMVFDLCVSPIIPALESLYPASPSLQRLAWASLRRLHRYYDPLRLPFAHLGSLRSSLVHQYLDCLLKLVSFLQAR